MNEYLMIFRNEKNDDGQMPSSEQMQTVMTQWKSWIKEIAAKGKYSSTNRLLPEGKTLKPGNVITDGPYLEAKEIVGGYLIVKADSLNEATEMAKSCPNLIYGGNVEVRSIMSVDYDANSNQFLNPR